MMHFKRRPAKFVSLCKTSKKKKKKKIAVREILCSVIQNAPQWARMNVGAPGKSWGRETMRNKGKKEWSCGEWSCRENLMGEICYDTWSFVEQMWAFELLLWPQINVRHMQTLIWHPSSSVYFFFLFHKITMPAVFVMLSLNIIGKSPFKGRLFWHMVRCWKVLQHVLAMKRTEVCHSQSL